MCLAYELSEDNQALGLSLPPQSSPLCMAGVHAGVVSNVLGGQISVVISKGIPYYESSLANNVTSVV